MSTYTPQYTRPYENGYVDRPDESTPEYARFINSRDDALIRIEAFLTALNIPTKLSDLVNDEGFINNTVSNLANYYLKSETYARTETYTQSEVQALIADAVSKVSGKLNILVVDALPTSDISTTTFYLVPKETTQEKNLYDEYINTDGTESGWEFIGGVSTSIDLSDYYKKSEVDALLEGKMNKADLVPSKFEGTKAVVGNQVLSGGGTYVVSDLDYSTEEQLTGRRWVDGKPIYQKTIEFSDYISFNSNTWVSIDNSGLYDTVISVYALDNSYKTIYPLIANSDDGNLKGMQTRNVDTALQTFIVEYTKTTDTASSPVAPPKVEAMHVYSTEEKVVGTWIDGKTLYEKTVVYEGAITSGTVVFTDSSIDEIIDVFAQKFFDTHVGNWISTIYSIYELYTTHMLNSVTAQVNSAYGSRITKCICTIQYTKTTDTATA